MFDTEKWPVAKDTESRTYCGVIDNRVEVMPLHKHSYTAFIKVPSDLFYFLREVGGLTVDQLLKNPICFYLEQERNRWYFGMSTPDGEFVDLWPYKDLPGWAFKC